MWRVNRLTFQEVATKSKEEMLALFSVHEDGLTFEEAKRRLQKAGAEELALKTTVWFLILLRQFASAFISLLFGAAVVALLLGEYVDAGVVLLFLLINAFLGFYQEFRAEAALQLLQEFVERKTRVRRGGNEVSILF